MAKAVESGEVRGALSPTAHRHQLDTEHRFYLLLAVFDGQMKDGEETGEGLSRVQHDRRIPECGESRRSKRGRRSSADRFARLNDWTTPGPKRPPHEAGMEKRIDGT